MSETGDGWVYVLSNPHAPNIVKIGHTTKQPEKRLKELEHAGAIPGYVVDYQAYTEKPYQLEQATHRSLKDLRVGNAWDKGNEFFRCSPEEAIVAVKQAASDTDIKIKYEEFKSADRAKAEAFQQEKIAEQERLQVQKQRLLEQQKREASVEAQLLSEETKLREAYGKRFEQEFPTPSFWFYWWWSLAIAFFLFALLFDENKLGGAVMLSIISAFIVGHFWKESAEEKQRKSAPYLALGYKMEYDLADIRSRETTCINCKHTIRFERKKELLASYDTKWHCPKCNAQINSPYSPKVSSAVNVEPAQKKQTEEKSTNYIGIGVIIVGAVIIITAISGKDNSPGKPNQIPNAPVMATSPLHTTKTAQPAQKVSYENFLNRYTESCFKNSRANSGNSMYSDAQLNEFCKCSANSTYPKLTQEEVGLFYYQQVTTQLQEKLNDYPSHCVENINAAVKEAHFAKIIAAHPYFEEIMNDIRFGQWIASLPQKTKNNYQRIIKKGTADEVIKMLDHFKKAVAESVKENATDNNNSQEAKTFDFRNCEYKTVMSDQDYRNCNINPPR
ncbi:MAG: GIY-YIG nuclease family protein [Methylovulum sp.]|uniref:GIY-YIG nuclease family protein n=1 Tax=Methylovulum sp. TaxID=1916980 RepID=UPI002633277F|nr:GIY-YIG nuclease family protein [Methylovulum sp.]MDD2723443.1 GIY-YIG nuclease family protein [Methylovulum sp.]MDD5124080.1 GIY-YIG nuclease family protein [Methylovulum sp.]